MKASHSSGKSAVAGKVEDDSSFILANRKGSFLNFSPVPVSKFNGWFHNDNGQAYRIIEDISLVNSPKSSEIRNNFFQVERRHKSFSERFFLPNGKDVLVYELSAPYMAEVFMDIRHAYDSRQWGRHYDVYYEKGCVVVEFLKKTHFFEDQSHDSKEYSFFVAVKHDGKSSFPKEWVYRKYSLDSKRQSFPDTRHVFLALKLVARKMVFSVSREKQKAISEATAAFSFSPELLSAGQKAASEYSADSLAYSCAAKSLHDLSAVNGIYAGLPWFFQFWSRDEAISAKAFIITGKADSAKKLLISRLKGMLPDGRLPNTHEAKSFSADSIGWLALRIGDLLDRKKLTAAERKSIAALLEKSVVSIRKNYEKDLLIWNRPLETWMDTGVASDTREGFRIEIQALQLAMYNLLFRLTKKKAYQEAEKKMRQAVREKFWNSKILADGIDDWTPRPNAFIAAYAYPQLLSKEEWTACFRNLLEHLWLDWGGLATIDKHHHLFIDEYSGEPPYSYHRGDSWFWLNNLAAIVMARTDKKRFRGYIEAIYAASEKDILWNGAIGSHSELSSAKEQRAEGCTSQAWSNAMFVELVNELKSKKNQNY